MPKICEIRVIKNAQTKTAVETETETETVSARPITAGGGKERGKLWALWAVD